MGHEAIALEAARRSRRQATVVAAGATAVLAGDLLLQAAKPSLVGRELGLVIAAVAFGLIFARAEWRAHLDLRVAAALSGVLLVLAVLVPPNSTDLWYYQMYGRIVVVHHDSPYKHSPAEYPGDPVLDRTGGIWNGVKAEYGPAFVVVASVVAAVTGTHPLAARLVWQGLAALAVAIALWLVARETRSGAAVALLGCNPVVVHSVVNGPHNDAFVGALIVAAVVLATRRRDVAAAMACSVALLVKAPAGLALAALVVWIAYHRGTRRAVVAGGAAGIMAIAATAAAGGRAVLDPMFAARARTTAATPWSLFRDNGFASFRGVFGPLGALPEIVPTVAVLSALLLAAWCVAATVAEPSPADAVAVAIGVWLLLALYPQAWLAGWAMPALALRPSSLATKLLVPLFLLRMVVGQWRLMEVRAGLRVTAFQYDVIRRSEAVLVSLLILAVVVTVVAFAFGAWERLRPRNTRYGPMT